MIMSFMYIPVWIKMSIDTAALVQIRVVLAPKIAFIFLYININMCLGAQKNRLIETVLLSTHNKRFG